MAEHFLNVFIGFSIIFLPVYNVIQILKIYKILEKIK